MKVYLVILGESYTDYKKDGINLINYAAGIYSSEEAAQDAIDDVKKTIHDELGIDDWDPATIMPLELDKTYPVTVFDGEFPTIETDNLI